MQTIARQFVYAGLMLALVLTAACTAKTGAVSQNAAAAAQGQPAPQGEATPDPATPKILTKASDYTQLLHPPQGEKLLDMSAEYAQAKAQIEAKLATIQDAELRERVSNEEWGKIDKDAYIAREEQLLRKNFPAQMRACLERHRADWFEIGHVDYPGTENLDISSVEASPVELIGYPSITVDMSTMDRVYSQFRQIAGQQINEGVAAWKDSQSCSARVRNACRNLGGSAEECSRPAVLQEVSDTLAGGGLYAGCSDNPSDTEGRKVVESAMRKDRLVLVGQGDLIASRIDKLLLVDYDTENVFLELDPKLLSGKLKWKYICSQTGCPNSPEPARNASPAATVSQDETPAQNDDASDPQ